jgi:hypothetical protein
MARPQEWLVSVDQVLRAGVSRQRLDRAVRSGRVVRACRGVYDLIPAPCDERAVDPELARDDLHDHRRRRAAWLGLLAHGPDTVAVGQTALVLLGVQGLPLEPRVEVTRPDRRGRQATPTTTLRRYAVRRRYHVVHGRLVVPVETALAQAVPELGRRHAVAVMDSALHRKLITPQGLRRAHDLARGRRGVESTHTWWLEADARAESPIETWARLACLDRGIPPDILQQEFRSPDGRLVARVDMAWWLGGGRWLVAELDGEAAHTGRAALVHDSRRQNRLVAAGHNVQRYAGRDAWDGTPALHLERILEAHRWRPGGPVPPGPAILPDG